MSVFSELIDFFSQTVSGLRDGRCGNNLKYRVSDAVKSAFSVFYLQNPSFLSSQAEPRGEGAVIMPEIFGQT